MVPGAAVVLCRRSLEERLSLLPMHRDAHITHHGLYIPEGVLHSKQGQEMETQAASRLPLKVDSV